MTTAPRMPFDAEEFLIEASAMSPSERGVYISLLANYWIHGPLPDNPTRLARLAGTSDKNWGRIWKIVGVYFQKKEGSDDWHHERLNEEREHIDTVNKKRALSGQKGGLISRGRASGPHKGNPRKPHGDRW